MSEVTNKVSQPYPTDMIQPKDLPDVAPPEHPTPWTEEDAFNGHVYLHDANGVIVAHVYIWDDAASKIYSAKLASINQPKGEKG